MYTGHGNTWLDQVIKITSNDETHRRTPSKRTPKRSSKRKNAMENRNSIRIDHSTAKFDHFKTNQIKDFFIQKKKFPSILPFVNGMEEKDISVVRKLLGGIHTYIQSFCGEFIYTYIYIYIYIYTHKSIEFYACLLIISSLYKSNT
jgi:hypothetical protein